MEKIEATIKIDHAQYWMLRTRYGKRKGIGADKLIKMAVLEIVSMQAKKELEQAEVDLGIGAEEDKSNTREEM